MTIFVDASALIAVIAGEEEADTLADALEADPDRICSAMAVWEATAGLCRSHGLTIPAARALVREFLEAGGIRLVPIGAAEGEAATDAYARFGKGRHPAALNMGDCFAYGCASAHGARLLYKGADFVLTDLG
jgi:ribonuclease VapC